MKLSDYVVSFLEKKGIKFTFGVTGGGAMHLNDSFGKSKKIKFIMTHHEQAASMAAEGYTRKSGNIGICNVTTGPGGTNSITGVTGAWIDSIPQLIISGQVAKKDMINNSLLRQKGIQEINIIDLVKPVTKYALSLKNENKIKYELEKCFYLSTNKRQGPTWIDIPLDIQAKQINPNTLKSFKPPKMRKTLNNNQFNKIFKLIKSSSRPVIIIGNGIHSSKSNKETIALIKKFNIPVLSSWNASDILKSNNNKYIGRFGLFGDRASNFTVQNSDLLIILGSRMSQPQTGYNLSLFAPEAKYIYVDIDKNEIKKFSKKNIFSVISDLKLFLMNFLKFMKNRSIDKNTNIIHLNWLKKTIAWKSKYPVVLKKYRHEKKINSFHFIDEISKRIKKNSCIVTDMGTSFTCTMQTYKPKGNQRLFTSSGLAAMGFGLPGSIGASFADKKKDTICITGDGGFMFNIQELQTIKHYKLPIKIFILCNKGYLTMKLMQKKNFKKLIGSDSYSGIKFPNFKKLANTFSLKYIKLTNKILNNDLDKILKRKESILIEVNMPPFQELIPRMQNRLEKDGTFIVPKFDDLYPHLDLKQLEKERQKAKLI